MRVGTNTAYQVPGIPSRFSIYEIFPTREQSSSNTERMQEHLGKENDNTRQLARLIGMLTASIPAVLQAPLHYRALQRLRNRSLRNNRYDQQVELDVESRQDLLWWIHHFPLHNGKSLATPVANVLITSDASTVGWGATCQNRHAGGPWSKEEKKAHINFLELKAAFISPKSPLSQADRVYMSCC